jgi:hypothetical protein
MLEQIGDPLRIFGIGLAPWNRFDMLGVHDQDLDLTLKQVIDRFPVHASPNATKNVLNWEYTREILRSDLRARLRDQLQAPPPGSQIIHEGPCPQGPGASHVQTVPSSKTTTGGQHHV